MKSEHMEQVEFVGHAKQFLRSPEINRPDLIKVLWAIPNGGARDGRTAGALKMEGVRKGVPDLFFGHASCGYHGLFIEMKKQQGGRVSPEQKEIIRILQSEGFCCHVTRGAEKAMDIFKRYVKGLLL